MKINRFTPVETSYRPAVIDLDEDGAEIRLITAQRIWKESGPRGRSAIIDLLSGYTLLDLRSMKERLSAIENFDAIDKNIRRKLIGTMRWEGEDGWVWPSRGGAHEH